MKQPLNDKNQDNYSGDVFQDIVHGQPHQTPEIQRNVVELAMRCSMKARGADSQQIKEEQWAWALQGQNKIKNRPQAPEKIYKKQGILYKQSPNFFGGWEQRFCVLKGQRLIYKQNKYADSQTAGILNFNLLSCDINIIKKGNFYISFTITIKNCDKSFVFKAPSASDNEQWSELLKEVIHKSEGFAKNYSYLSTYPRFWRKDYESETEFRTKAETGDIMLFRGKKSTSTMQRALTMDEFDHIGIVLLNGKGDVLIFEANGGFGVGLCPWRRFVDKKWFNQYQLIVHRHLNILRTEQLLQTVDSFVNSNLGKKYDFSLKEYLFGRNSSNEEESEFFFCSSLVAKLFKRLQLLDKQKSSTQYLPSSFSNKEKLILKADGRFGKVSLQDQKIVVFQNMH